MKHFHPPFIQSFILRDHTLVHIKIIMDNIVENTDALHTLTINQFILEKKLDCLIQKNQHLVNEITMLVVQFPLFILL